MTLNIAHRGGAALWPENTRAAFADAIASGCDGAELDVQLSRDGTVVVHHDFRLMADVARKDGAWLDEPGPRIKDLSFAEMQTFDVGRPRPGSRYAHAHSLLTPVDGAAIPSLDAVIALAKQAPRPFDLLVELKCDASPDSADPVALANAAYNVVAQADFLANVIFVGFDWRALARIRQRGASCWFTTDRLRGDAGAVIDTIVQAGGQGWFPHHSDAGEESVAYARSKGLKVAAWTVNDVEQMQELKGLDALCTDRPDLLASLF
jgi:glycerophosphoryl diester phosphodiesterase